MSIAIKLFENPGFAGKRVFEGEADKKVFVLVAYPNEIVTYITHKGKQERIVSSNLKEIL